MWHLKSEGEEEGYRHLKINFLFHTMDDVTEFILNQNQMLHYELKFIPIYEPPEPKSLAELEEQAADRPMAPIPLSRTRD